MKQPVHVGRVQLGKRLRPEVEGERDPLQRPLGVVATEAECTALNKRDVIHFYKCGYLETALVMLEVNIPLDVVPRLA
jgi:hypothetical protein